MKQGILIDTSQSVHAWVVYRLRGFPERQHARDQKRREHTSKDNARRRRREERARAAQESFDFGEPLPPLSETGEKWVYDQWPPP